MDERRGFEVAASGGKADEGCRRAGGGGRGGGGGGFEEGKSGGSGGRSHLEAKREREWRR